MRAWQVLLLQLGQQVIKQFEKDGGDLYFLEVIRVRSVAKVVFFLISIQNFEKFFLVAFDRSYIGLVPIFAELTHIRKKASRAILDLSPHYMFKPGNLPFLIDSLCYNTF